MKIYASNVYIYFCKDEIWQKNNIHDTQTFGVQDKTDNVLIGFAEFLDSLKESVFKTNKADNLLKIICLLWYNQSKNIKIVRRNIDNKVIIRRIFWIILK